MTRLFAVAAFCITTAVFFPALAQDQQQGGAPLPLTAEVPAAPAAVVASEPPAAVYSQTDMLLEQASAVPAQPAASQDDVAPSPSSFDPEAVTGDVPQSTDADVTVIKDPYGENYLKGTPDNLSKLYWRLRVFDLEDDYAVDNYMLINECDLYQRYINDDFEWTKLRNAARSVLKKDRDKYNNRFVFILPVKLGRYDTEMGGFHLVNNTHFDTVRRMEITGNSLSRAICGKTGEVKDYPRNLMLILKDPMTYTFAKVDEHVAQAYIIRKQKEVLDYEYDTRQSRYNRMAYARLRVVLDEYQGTVKGQNSSILAVLHGRLEGVDLFEDPYGKILLSKGQMIEGTPDPKIAGPARTISDPMPSSDTPTGSRALPSAASPEPAVNPVPDDRSGAPAVPTAPAGQSSAPAVPDAPTVGETIETLPADVKVEIKQPTVTQPPATPPSVPDVMPFDKPQDY